MLRIISIILLTLLATLSLRSQCGNSLEINVISTFCVPNSDTGAPEYYVYFTGNQSLGTTSFYNYFVGSPAVNSQHPYGLPHVVGPVTANGNGIVLVIVDGQDPNCTASEFISIADLECSPLECNSPPLVLDITQETICPGDPIEYFGVNPNLYSREGFQVTEQLSTVPFGDDTQFFGTIGGRANPSIYAQPNTRYYVRLAYSLVTQNGPQYDFDCTLLSNVDSFYVGGTDLSHLQNGYDLNCMEAPLELTAAVNGPVPPVIVWALDGAPFSTQNTVTLTQTGQYTVSVTDARGCSTVKDFIIQNQGLTDLPTEFNLLGCDDDPVYCIPLFQDEWTIQWPEGIEADFNCATNLTPGEEYDVTISNQFGCTETITYLAQFPFTAFLFAEAVGGENCENQALRIILELNTQPNSAIEVFITQVGGDFSRTETYFESGFYTVPDLPSGTYLINGLTSSGCSITGSQVTISGGGPEITSGTVTDVSCHGAADGSINLTVNGGQAPYIYSWSGEPGEGSPNITGLPSGTYSFTINDANGCATEAEYEIVEPAPLEIELINLENSTCGANNGLLEIEVTGGNSTPNNNYTVFWSNDWDTELNQSLEAGNYTVNVVDQNGCELSQTFTIEDTGFEVIIDATVPFIGCGNPSVQLFANPVLDGSTIAWFGPDGFSADQPVITITEPGEYLLQILDANGCEGSSSILIGDETQTPELTATATPVTCDVPGSILADLSNLNSESTFAVYFVSNDGNVRQLIEFIDFALEQQYSFNDLPAGFYELVATSEYGCQTTVTVEVENQTNIELLDVNINDIICDGETGSIDVAFSSTELTYLWDYDNSTSEDLTNIEEAGLITLTVMDEFGCIAQFSFIVNSQGAFGSAVVEETEPFCGANPGTLCAIVQGGAQPLSFLWNNGSTDECLVDIIPGNYTVTITDANGCTVIANGTLVNRSFGLEVNVVNPSCNLNNGSIEAVFSQELQNATYQWSNGATTRQITNLGPGDYSITVTNQFGCTEVVSTSLTSLVLIADIDQIGEFSCGSNSVQLLAFPLGEYAYEWTGPNGFTGNTQIVEIETPGIYAVTVLNPDTGCTSTFETNVEDNEAGFTVSLVFENQEDCNEGVVLRPIYSQEYEESELQHEWVLPNGEVLNNPIGGLFVQETGLYTYTATDLETGCQVTTTIFVSSFRDECHNLSGRLFADEGNCIYDGTEIIVPSWRVEIEATDGSFATTGFTDAAGNWEANVPTGTFTVRALPYVEPLYTECVPLQTVTVTNGTDATVDVLMPYTAECASMFASVTIPFLRRCFENDFYIFYCNDGPVVAENAQLLVEMDPFLDFIEASITPSSIAARTVTFELGDLPPFFCGSINITALVSCTAELGQTHCVEVTATPNDPCPEPNNWNGANLTIEADCNGDEITFSLKNTGSATMSVPLQYIVIEDGIMLMPGPQPGPVLEINESLDLTFPANGSTYYVQSNQEPGNPAFDMPTLVIEGCGLNDDGNFTTGLVNNLPLGDNGTNWYDISCRDNVGSYDPNTKVGFPLGVGNRNYIAEGTKLTYDIYFQNTGTDTAFTVVIRDTLATELDPKTIRMGASSHSYVAALDSNNVLTVTFENILLPDSTTDLAGSQGVVQFTIDHAVGLPLETEIRNDADIYFDFNEPIRTDTTLHTLGDDFLPTEVREIVIVTGGLEVYPNPSEGHVNFTLDLPGVGPYRLRLYDAFGRELRTQSQTKLTGVFDLSGLPRGWYLLRGENEGRGARAAVRILLQ